MQLKTSKAIYSFTAITLACTLLGGIAQCSKSRASSQAETIRGDQMKVVAQEKLAQKCRLLDGGQFQRGEIIEEEGGLTPTSCYKNKQGDFAYAAYEGGRLKIIGVYSTHEINSRISEIKVEKKK